MDISVCILTHNQPTLLPECVEACLSEIARSQVTGEIIIIDNASADGYPKQVVDRFPAVRVIRNEENRGFSAANNQAIRAGSGRFVLILNDDAILQEGSLRPMLQTLDSSFRIGAVGPKLVNPDGSPQRGFTNRRFPHLRGVLCQTLFLEALLERNAWTRDLLTMSRKPGHRGDTEHLAGACLLVRRAALDQIGLFDERFHYWFEDVDLCVRLKERGWRLVYLPDARVIHWGSASLRTLTYSHRNAIYFKSLAYYFKKHSSRAGYVGVRVTLAMVLFARTAVGAVYKLCRRDASAKQQRAWLQAWLRLVGSILWERE